VESLLSRARGLVMVQLVVGWDAAAPQPVHNPLLLHSLGRALQDPNISIFMSKAAGEGCAAQLRVHSLPGECALLALHSLRGRCRTRT
jgi:hypothetical protein